MSWRYLVVVLLCTGCVVHQRSSLGEPLDNAATSQESAKGSNAAANSAFDDCKKLADACDPQSAECAASLKSRHCGGAPSPLCERAMVLELYTKVLVANPSICAKPNAGSATPGM